MEEVDSNNLTVNRILKADFKSSVFALVKLYGESMPNDCFYVSHYYHSAISNLSLRLPNELPSNMVLRKPFRHMVFPDRY